ncbi:MAG: FAD-dependent oxidoreductase [Thermodesulfobacteriota bacterium]
MSERMKKDPTGAVLVAGGGIAGIQASLDLAESGYLVYLVESKSSIGGRMSQLDKTFPTNDCAMCMISPKLIGVASHPNIRIMTMTDLVGLTGEPGFFTATVRKRPRYVIEDRCVGCGICAEKCPAKAGDAYNENMAKRKAIGLLYPQAVPLTYSIDRDACIYFKKGTCRACEKFCKNKAIDFEQTEELVELPVGSVILAPGIDTFQAEKAVEYGYGRYPNVITTMEFERFLSATGPTDGEVLRPSDKTAPHKVAWIQCVGSRENIRAGRRFCSSICCMAATKEAVVAKSHHADMEASIFFMDLRAQGKGFDSYCDRAKGESGVRYIRSMISRVTENPVTKDLTLAYQDPATGKMVEETFGLVVLAVGLRPSAHSAALAKAAGIEVNEFGFAKVAPETGLASSRDGVFVCGAFEGPKDIPETVAQASAAAAAATVPIAAVKGYEVKAKAKVAEHTQFGKKPRVGVFVCCCGTNIAGVVDVQKTAEYAKTIPGVVHSEVLLFACSTDSKVRIKEEIIKNNLNRVVIASCSPKTHEDLFRDILREAGVNPFLMEMANIRNHCSWVHAKNPEAATQKAQDLIRMSVGRVKLLAPIEAKSVPVTPVGLVVGGGLAGLTAALTLAKHGYVTHIVERSDKLGGRHLDSAPIAGFHQAAFVAKLAEEARSHPKIRVHLSSVVEKTAGHVGGFVSTIKKSDGTATTVKHGTGIIATGAVPTMTDLYLSGKHPAVLTQEELARKISKGPVAGNGQTVAMIQCVGSRDAEHPYCSRVCCTAAVENAIRIKEKSPAANVLVFYRDIRTFGLRELAYEKARQLGVVFINFDPADPPQAEIKDGALTLSFFEPALRRRMSVTPDLLALSTGLSAHPEVHQVSNVFKVPVDKQGFLLEAHVKLRPLDFATDGLFLAGDAHTPKFPEEVIIQAMGAAGRAVSILAKDAILVGPCSEVNSEKCAACLTCVRTCPYHIPAINADGVSTIDPARCQGCGMCAAECPVQAITVHHSRTDQIEEKMSVLFTC